jgi:hypothetical protein
LFVAVQKVIGGKPTPASPPPTLAADHGQGGH